MRIPGEVFACLRTGELRITLSSGSGMAEGGAPRDVPIELVPTELRLPNTKLWVQLNDAFEVESVTERHE
jgi:hypothetical protein